MSSFLNIVLQKGNVLCFLHAYLERNGYEKIIFSSMIIDSTSCSCDVEKVNLTLYMLSGSFINECLLPDLLDVQQTFSLVE